MPTPLPLAAPYDWIAERLRDQPTVTRLAFYAGAASIVAAAIVALWAVALRVAYQLRTSRRADVRRRWTNLVLEYLDGQRPPLPRLKRWDRRAVIGRLNYLFDTLRGDAHDELRRLMSDAGIDRAVESMLRERNAAGQLIALTAVAQMRLERLQARVTPFVDDPRTAHSLAAARALMQVDPAHGAGIVLDRLPSRDDWHVTRIVELLEGSQQAIGPALGDLLRAAEDPELAARIIAVIESLKDGHGISAVRRLLAGGRRLEPRVMAAAVDALGEFGDPRDIEVVRPGAVSLDPQVRMETAVAIGKLGSDEDVPVLSELLHDPSPAVRREAARALVRLPAMSKDRIKVMLSGLREDSDAHSTLRRALLELRAS
ncbi:MAG: HEAT repeat domain-containing protein [Candidatus Binatia bacterium]